MCVYFLLYVACAGTESILLAAKTHRDYYRAEKGVTDPEIVACTSAHAAIDKACNLMGIRLIKVSHHRHGTALFFMNMHLIGV
jgi:glutamate/tyrosine decarboxylase-like PLP-dependent enzyme